MIRTLTGTVTHHLADGVVVEVNGVGYLVAVPLRTLPALGERRTFFTYQHVREDTLALFGFEALEELELFRQLLTVPSIGPKLALAVLSAAPPSAIRDAVATENVSFFRAVPGLGAKGAAKLIVELRGKAVSGGTGVPSGSTDLVEALTGLGYTLQELQPVLTQVPVELATLEAKLSWALQQLGR